MSDEINGPFRCPDCLEVMNAEKWLGHKCGNNYRVVESNKTICNDCSYTGESRINAVCIECQKLMSQPVITRAHLRTLASMISCPGCRAAYPCDNVKFINGTLTNDATTAHRPCSDILIDYAISHPTEE